VRNNYVLFPLMPLNRQYVYQYYITVSNAVKLPMPAMAELMRWSSSLQLTSSMTSLQHSQRSLTQHYTMIH